MPLESYHNTPPDASFSGTGSSAWVEAHNLRMEGGGFLVGRETAGTGAPENIAIGANLTLSGGTLSASGGTAAAGVSLVQGVAPILVGGTATSTVSLATSGVTAGTYGGPLVIPRFDVSAQGLIQSASQAGTIGTMASFTSYVAAGDVLGTSTTGTLTTALSTTGVAAGTYGTGGTMVAQISVDAKGRILTATNVGITFPASTGGGISALVGDVSGTSTTGTLTNALSTTGVTAGTYGGTAGIPRFDIDAKGRMLSAASHPLQGSAPIAITTGAGTFVVSHNTSGVAAGTYGDGTAVAQVVVNALGHLTAGTSVPITFPTVRVLEAAAPIAVATAAGTYTVSHNTSGISAGTYGGTLGVARFGVSAEGHVTAAANHALEATAPILLATNAGTFAWSHGTSGAAAGTFGTGNDLVQLAVNALGHVTSVATSGTIGTMGRFSSYTMAGAALGTSTTGTMTVALSTTGVTAGTYGNATTVGQFVVDAGGRITLATGVNIAGAGTLAVTQGTTTVSTVNRIHFTTNATVTSTAAGIADVAITAGTGGSSTWDTIGAAAGDGTTSNTTHRIVYQVAATADSRISWRFTESAASSGGTSTSGVPNQVLLQLDTVAASTMSPLKVLSRGAHVFSVSPTSPKIVLAAGSASQPVLCFAGAENTGFFLSGSAIGIAGSGSEKGKFEGNVFHWRGDGLAYPNEIGAYVTFTHGSNAPTATLATHRLLYSESNATGPILAGLKTRGTANSQTAITSGDTLFQISALGYVGSTNTRQEAARITFDSTGTISDSATGIGGIIRFSVAKVGAEPAEIMRLEAGTTTGGGWLSMNEADANPATGDLAADDAFAVYRKADKLVFAYNLAGVMNYLTIPLDGSSTAWTNGTTAP